jgi:indolepyruvate ferredoxin oxidoreductase, alpha subunit
MEDIVLLGDEAVALGAIHAGLSAAYGYPGTPSTEIMEYLISARESDRAPIVALWCANEKTAYEAALGMSFAGKRAIVTMKHVGLNVAADPFVNSALLDIKGGLVLAVADDPSMHSSQDEQDSRFYADYAGIPCLEPRSQQEAYDMALAAFELSEELALPVMLRLTTRLAHARASVKPGAARPQNKLAKAADRKGWTLLPAYARKRYELLCAKQAEIAKRSEASGFNRLTPGSKSTVVITTGLGGNYYEENLRDFIAALEAKGASGRAGDREPARLHVGFYPVPDKAIRELCAGAGQVIVIEEGQPFLERRLRGILAQELPIRGKIDGLIPLQGELTPESVRASLGLPARASAPPASIPLPSRPPQLCQGCPHGDSYQAIKDAVADLDPAKVSINADIGCYALGALPPFSVPETLVCMGASVSMAGGAADAGIEYAIGVIGDSTFLHSGITPLIDAVSARKAVTIVILDNSIVAMTGCQDTILPSARLRSIVEGVGVESEHVVEIEATRMKAAENVAALRREIEYRGPSVVLARRECLEAFRLRKKKEKGTGQIGGNAAAAGSRDATSEGGRE